ncbi:MAG: hypothetical protein IK054_08230 [Lachnospiraceae bacterium]|nr:hypothetical protein [Lachnospiraceae bacterium]
MKREFYDPPLVMCTSQHSNTMGAIVYLTEPVDGKLLSEAVENVRTRFPYFYVRAKVEGNDLVAIPNPLPVTVRNTWAPIKLNSEEAGYHFMAVKYEGNRLAVEMCHSLSDGAGFLPFFKSILFCYLSSKTGESFDPKGFRLPGDTIPETEIGDPFPGLDLDRIEKPLYEKPFISDFYRFNDTFSGDEGRKAFYVRLPEDEVMKYCKEKDGSPNVLMSVLMIRAVGRIDPENEKPVTVGIAFDHKAQLGNYDNYRQFADIVYVSIPRKFEDEDISSMCTLARGQLMLQAQPENSLFNLKRRKMGHEQMSQLPLEKKIEILKASVTMPRATASVSYANSRTFGPLDPYISEVYMMGEPTVIGVLCEIACHNHHFFLTFAQSFTNESYFEAFMKELETAGISAEVMHKDNYDLCGVRYDDIDVPGL